MNNKAIYLRLLRHVLPYWKTFAIAIVSMVFLAATEPAIPALLGPLLDGSFISQDITQRRLIPLFIILLFLAKGIFSFSSEVANHWVANRVVMDLRRGMFDKLLQLPSQFYDEHASGVLISKFTFDVTQVAQAATKSLMVMVKDSLAVVCLVGYMMWVSWNLALAVFVIAPLVALVIKSVSRRMRDMSQRVQHSMADINHVAQEAINGHRVVKVFAGQAYETSRFTRAINKVRQYSMKVVVTSSLNTPIILLIMATVLAFIVYIAAGQAAAGKLSLGEFVAFFTAMSMLLPPVKRLTNVNESLQRGLAAAASVFQLIDESPEADEGRRDIGRMRGDIVFDRVGLSYNNSHANALNDISLTIPAGCTVALVGTSGSGKSTLVNLVPRFYQPTSGRILIDGIDSRDITLSSLRANISLVNQEITLFNDTIRNNIAYGALREHDVAEIEAAAQAAHVMEFVDALPQGLDTMIGEAGVLLSGGQRQRLVIARALLKDAPVLILDEATSALDSAAEQHIHGALNTLRQGRTCIIIAHRLSTVENADVIVVLQGGKMVEQGSHEALLKQHGVYCRLHRLQFAGSESSDNC